MKYLIRSGFICILIACSLSFFFLGCSTKDDTSKKTNLTNVTLAEELSISADTDEALVGNFSGLAVDETGNIYAADTDQQKIHAFSPDGKYVDSIGRKGKGPGEFSDLDAGIRIAGDTLYALQTRARRIDFFDLKTKDPIRSISIPETEVNGSSLGSPQKIFPQNDGGFLVYFLNPYFRTPEDDDPQKFATVAALDAFGEFINPKVAQVPSLYPSDNRIVLIESGSISVFVVDLYPTIQVEANRAGQFYIGNTDSLSVRTFDDQGLVKQQLNHLYSPPSFTNADLDSMVAATNATFEKAINKVGVPEKWPAFSKMILDDSGQLWMGQFQPKNEPQTWWGFNNEGQPHWEFTLPANVELHQIKDDKAYGIARSAESFPAIKRYKVNDVSSRYKK